MDGHFFQGFVERKFPLLFERAGKPHSRLWIQDGDPSQNCAAAKKAFQDVNAELLSIPARSPDVNPIENLFHIIRKELKKQAFVRAGLTVCGARGILSAWDLLTPL